MRPPLPGSETADSLNGNDRSYASKVRRPWQDRRTLKIDRSTAAATVSRRLALGFRTFAKTMKDNRNVQYSSCTTGLGWPPTYARDRQTSAAGRRRGIRLLRRYNGHRDRRRHQAAEGGNRFPSADL